MVESFCYLWGILATCPRRMLLARTLGRQKNEAASTVKDRKTHGSQTQCMLATIRGLPRHGGLHASKLEASSWQRHASSMRWVHGAHGHAVRAAQCQVAPFLNYLMSLIEESVAGDVCQREKQKSTSYFGVWRDTACAQGMATFV